jgi:hypothetical protein
VAICLVDASVGFRVGSVPDVVDEGSCVAAELGISQAGLYDWARQDHGEFAGIPTSESSGLRHAIKRVRHWPLCLTASRCG